MRSRRSSTLPLATSCRVPVAVTVLVSPVFQTTSDVMLAEGGSMQ
ncbi:hypothetical protein ACWFNS_05240 [Oerskovia enterophila]